MEWAAGLVSSAMGRPQPADPTPSAPWPKFTGTDFECYEGEKEEVPAMSEFTVEISLKNLAQSDMPSSLFYSFATTPQEGFGFTGAGPKGNIGFRVEFSRGWAGQLEVILAQATYQSHLEAVRGELQLPSLRGDCKLHVIWDNTNSLLASKELSYKLLVVQETHIVRPGAAPRKQIRIANPEPEPEPDFEDPFESAAGRTRETSGIANVEGSWM